MEYFGKIVCYKAVVLRYVYIKLAYLWYLPARDEAVYPVYKSPLSAPLLLYPHSHINIEEHWLMPLLVPCSMRPLSM